MEQAKSAIISQPMANKSEEEIKATREKATEALNNMGYDVENTLYTFEWYAHDGIPEPLHKPLKFLAKTLDIMSRCHAVYFCKGWEQARGCKIEHAAAVAYGLEIFYE